MVTFTIKSGWKLSGQGQTGEAVTSMKHAPLTSLWETDLPPHSWWKRKLDFLMALREKLDT
jgi:hypothetical protein